MKTITQKTNHEKWTPYVRVDMDAPTEIYVMVSDDIGEVEADSLHTNKADAEARAAELATQMGCAWGTNYEASDV